MAGWAGWLACALGLAGRPAGVASLRLFRYFPIPFILRPARARVMYTLLTIVERIVLCAAKK